VSATVTIISDCVTISFKHKRILLFIIR